MKKVLKWIAIAFGGLVGLLILASHPPVDSRSSIALAMVGSGLHLGFMPQNTARLYGALADRYRIEKHLGEGGMGPLITLMNTDTADV